MNDFKFGWVFHLLVAFALLIQFYGRDKLQCDKTRMIVVLIFSLTTAGALVLLVAPAFSAS